MQIQEVFKEIPAGKFHSAILTTFSLDFYFLEHQVLRLLRSKSITNIIILADQKILHQSLGRLTGRLQHLGRHYSVHGIPMRGSSAFHPKVNLFLGKDKSLLLMGSGNLTSGGHGKNHELWGAFYVDNEEDPQFTLFLDAWNYLQYLGEGLKGVGRQQLEWAVRHCGLLENAPRNMPQPAFFKLSEALEVAFLFNGEDRSISRQLRSLLPNEAVRQITIASPFFDRDGALLSRLQKDFAGATLNVIVQPEYAILPGNQLAETINWYQWGDVAEQSLLNAKNKKQHSKFFLFETADTQYLLLGSANATMPGLGLRNGNAEASLLLRSQQVDFFRTLGIHTGNARPVGNITDLERPSLEEQEDAGEADAWKYHLLAADLHGTKLDVYFDRSPEDASALQVQLLSGRGGVIESLPLQSWKKTVGRLDLPKGITPSVLHLALVTDQAGIPVTNRQVIHHLADIHRTNPSPSYRRLNQLMQKIEGDWGNTFDLVDYFYTVNQQKADLAKGGKALRTHVQTREQVVPEEAVTLSYDEFSALARSKSAQHHFERYLQSYQSIRIIDSILSALDDKEQRRQARETEEEEMIADLSATSGREEEEEHEVRVSSFSILERLRRRFDRFFHRYIDSLQNRIWDEQDLHKINIVDLSMYLIILHILLDLTGKIVAIEKNETEEIFLLATGKQGDMNFRSFAYDIIGGFTLLLERKGGFDRLEDPYLSKKQALYRRRALEMSLFIITVIDRYTHSVADRDKWGLPLFSNVISQLGEPQRDLLKPAFRKFWKESSLTRFDLAAAMEGVDYYLGEYHKYTGANEPQVIVEGALLEAKQLGYCRVQQVVYHHQSGEPVFVKLNRPGFPYQEATRDFTFDRLYGLKDGRLIKSKSS